MQRVGSAQVKVFNSACLLVACLLSVASGCRSRPVPPPEQRRMAVEVGGLTGDGGSAGGGLTSSFPIVIGGGACVPGRVRCEGAALQTCSPDGSGFTTTRTCDSAALCQTEPAGCAAAACLADEMTCDGALLTVCSTDRTSFLPFAQCDSPAHCSAAERRCLTEPCTAGDLRCNRPLSGSPEVQRCSEDRADWESIGPCETRQLCDETIQAAGLGTLTANSDGVIGAGSEAPVEVVECLLARCQPGEVQCQGAALVGCNPGQTAFEEVDLCASAAICEQSLLAFDGAGELSCLSPACDAGAFRCSSAGALEVCDEARSGFRLVQQCIGAAFCDAANGTCNEAPCAPGSESCNDAQPQRCRDDQTGFEPLGEACRTAALCNDDADSAFCEMPACLRDGSSSSEFQCQGAALLRCNEGLTGYEALATCATAALCDSESGVCLEPVCQPEEHNCEGGTLQRCNGDQTAFADLENCGDASQCDATAGACTDPCEPGSVRCTPQGEVERCEDRLTGWQTVADCLTPQLCDAEGGCIPPVCTPGERRCVERGEGSELQQCAPGRDQFDLLAACSEGQVCDAAGSQCDECEAGSVRCAGDTLVSCSADGQREFRQACEDGLCDAEAGRCLACAPIGNSRCQGSQLFVCRQGGQGEFEAAEFCETPELCQQTLQGCGPNGENCQCREGVCGPGEVRCFGNALQQCNPGRTDFNFLDNCGDGLCNAVQRRCDECAGNASFCTNDTTRQFCDNGLFQQQNCAAAGDICVNGQCVEPACFVGQFNCFGNALQRCNNQRTAFDFIENCSQGLCNAGAQRCDQCAGNASSCVTGTTRQFCNNGLFQQQNCAGNGQICNAGRCEAPACNAGQFSCNGNALQRCNANRTGFDFVQNCAQGLCNAGAGRCDQCLGNGSTCVTDRVRETCVNGLLQRQTCPGAQQCTGNGVCALPQVCTPNTSFCEGGRPVQCNATGTGTTALALCQPNNVARTCRGNSLVPILCAPNTEVCDQGACRSLQVCTPNQVFCNGGQGLARRCNATGTASTPVAACSNDVLTRCQSASGLQTLTCRTDIGQFCDPTRVACSCNTGSVCPNTREVAVCTGGVTVRVTACPAGESCTNGACRPPPPIIIR